MNWLIRTMRQEDEREVREVYARCHPTWPVRPTYWYFTNPTLVVEDLEHLDIVGFNCLSIQMGSGLVLAQGTDTCVLPEYQGHGLGRELWVERAAIARSVGATMISGTTQPKNLAMQRIMAAQGLHQCQTILRYFPDGEDALLFLGPLGD